MSSVEGAWVMKMESERRHLVGRKGVRPGWESSPGDNGAAARSDGWHPTKEGPTILRRVDVLIRDIKEGVPVV